MYMLFVLLLQVKNFANKIIDLYIAALDIRATLTCLLSVLMFFSGICYGLQLAVIEYARNILGWKGEQYKFFRRQ